jgi:hypothetical protein
MQIIVDVYDATGQKLGDGPILTCRSAQITRKLDGAGEVALEIVGGDKRAYALIQNERRLVVYTVQNNKPREVGRGIVRDFTHNISEGEILISTRGPDILGELEYANTLRNYQFNLVETPDVLEALLALVSDDWQIDTAETAKILVTFNAVNILRAVRDIAQKYGKHFRLGDGKVIQYGPMGDLLGLRLIQVERSTSQLDENDNVALIERLNIQYTSESQANWIEPLGGGEGANILTLQQSTRNDPYFVQSTSSPGGALVYYLSDTASVTNYGRKVRVITFKDIVPISASPTDVLNASNALYDAAAAWLQRNSVPQTVYGCTVRKVKKTVRPGQRVRVVYSGWAYLEEQATRWIDLNDDLWVISVTENLGEDGAVLELELSDIDQEIRDEVSVIADTIEDVQFRNVI